MYLLYKIFSRSSKILSTFFVAVAVPMSFIFAVVFCVFWQLPAFLSGIGLGDVWTDIESSLGSAVEAINITRWVAFGLFLLIIVCWIIFITAWIVRKVLYKKIADNYIARNKEYRNMDINAYQEKLEKYRYRD